MGLGGLASHMAPPGSAWLPKHSCHFVLLKVGLLTRVEEGNGAGGEGGSRGQGRAADYFKGVCRVTWTQLSPRLPAATEVSHRHG